MAHETWSRLRAVMLWLNAIVAIASAGMLIYTFIAREHLTEKARAFVTEKTLEYSGPLVDAAQAGIRAPLAQKLLTADHRRKVQAEIDRYRANPAAYVAELTSDAGPLPAADVPQLVLDWKHRVRNYYDATLKALVKDLRIFAFTNLSAGVFAWLLAYHARRRIDGSVIWFTYTLFVAVVVSAVGYIDDLTFFRILFQTHPGWKYPCAVVALLGYLYWQSALKLERKQDDNSRTGS